MTERIRINDDFYIKRIAGNPVAGELATVMQHLKCGVIAKVDGLEPYGHDGHLVIANGDYEAVTDA